LLRGSARVGPWMARKSPASTRLTDLRRPAHGDLSGGTVEGSCYFLDGGAHAGEGQERCARWILVTCAIW
jgi:hypothetical protein